MANASLADSQARAVTPALPERDKAQATVFPIVPSGGGGGGTTTNDTNSVWPMLPAASSCSAWAT